MASENENIVEKIKKLLALAGNNPDPEEAKSAIMKAQVLMVKYSIDQKDLHTDEEIKVVSIPLTKFSGRTTWWAKSLAGVIASNFRCKSVINSHYKETAVSVIGIEQDAMIVKSIYSFAIDFMQTHSTRLVARYSRQGLPVKGVKNIFISGFLDGLDEAFKEQRNSSSEFALALIPKPEVAQDVARRTGGKMHKQTGIQPVFAEDPFARAAGIKAGRSFVKDEQSSILPL